jgi:dienelactone hydrolase
MTLAVFQRAQALRERRVIRRFAFALSSLVALGGAGPVTRTLAIPGRDGVPAHAVRVLLWAADGDGPHPFLVYEPSWGGRADENSRLATLLAKDGFTVAALDYDTEQPDRFAPQMRRMQVPLDLSSNAALARTTVEGDWRAVVFATDASVALDLMPEAQQAPTAGIFGWSFGGAVAIEACRQDARFRACLNMDGWMFGPAADDPSPQPTLVLSGDPYPAQAKPANNPGAILDERDGARLRARFAAVGGTYAQLAGLEHSGFSDVGNNATVHRLVRDFFASTLLGKPTKSDALPGVIWQRVKPPAG